MNIGLLILVILAIWSLASYLFVRGIEEPAYILLEDRGGYEIRQYNSYIIAEAEVNGDYRRSMNNGFRIIADYIFGNNTKQTSIDMTAPVLEESSEKIAMTIPVNEETTNTGTRKVSFVMPSKHTLETLPKPNNESVNIIEVPSKKVAVLKFSWNVTGARAEKKKNELQELLKADGVTMLSTPRLARYNPPLTIPFLLRNEVHIDIE